MKIINKFAGMAIFLASCIASAEQNKNIISAYQNQMKLLDAYQKETIQNKGLKFNELSFIMCRYVMKGYVIGKIVKASETALISQATDMLSIAYCQDLESEADMNKALVDMVNSQQSRSIEEISNNPPSIHISMGAVKKLQNFLPISPNTSIKRDGLTPAPYFKR